MSSVEKIRDNLSSTFQKPYGSVARTVSSDSLSSGKVLDLSKEKSEYKVLKEEDISYEFSRSSGPGGQKVNKTSSKVTLRLNLNSENFTDEERKKIKETHPGRVTNEGYFIARSQTSRSQKINKEAAKERAETLINEALLPKEARIDTEIPKSQKEFRLREKKIMSEKKELRKKSDFENW